MILTIGCHDAEITEGSDPNCETAGELCPESGGEGAGEGGDEVPPGCGDGVVADGEACDEGEDNGGDACNVRCQFAACGDGYVQPGRGEQCDDGGILSGDGCTADCLFPGAPLAQNDTLTELHGDYAVDVNARGDVFVVSGSDVGMQLAKFESTLEQPIWKIATVPTDDANLALTERGDAVVGGQLFANWRATVAMVREDHSGSSGEIVWNVPVVHAGWSEIVAVATADHRIVAAGYRGNRRQGILARLDPETGRPHTVGIETPLGAVAVESNGRAWVLGGGTEPKLLMVPLKGEAETFVLDPGRYEDIAVGPDGVYLLANVDGEGVVVSKLGFNATRVWTSEPFAGASANAFALIPDGALLVAGATKGMKRALLAWYDAESGELLHHVDPRGEASGRSTFEDVAVAPSGEFAVAVGGTAPDDYPMHLWIYEFTI